MPGNRIEQREAQLLCQKGQPYESVSSYSKYNRKRYEDGRSQHLTDSPMMAHLLQALEKGTDIGHDGQLTFVMVARHFLDEDMLVNLLSHQSDFNEDDAHALIRQVKAHGYNPAKRERILQWQAQQAFPMCPTPDEPGTCNVSQELRVQDDMYEHINDCWEEQAKAEENHESNASSPG